MTDKVIVTPAILSFLAAAHSAAPGAPLEERKERGQEARRFLLTPTLLSSRPNHLRPEES